MNLSAATRARLARENAGRQWRSYIAALIYRTDTGDDAVSAVARLLDVPDSPRAFAERHQLTWIEDEGE